MNLSHSFYNRFSINFGCDCENETCAFHFNPRPNEGVVIRNANLGGWGSEERDYEAAFPFNPGQYFDALFVCTEDKYLVCFKDMYLTCISDCIRLTCTYDTI